MNHKEDGPNASEQALMDQTNALLTDLLNVLEKHWPACELRTEYCIGKHANDMILEFAGNDAMHAKALMFLSIIRAAKLHAELKSLREDVAKSATEAIRIMEEWPK